MIKTLVKVALKINKLVVETKFTLLRVSIGQMQHFLPTTVIRKEGEPTLGIKDFDLK